MRVAVVTHYPERPGKPRGGVEAVSENLVRALSQMNDMELHVINTWRSFSSYERDQYGGFVLHRLPWAGGSVMRHAVTSGRCQLIRYLADLSPDVVHAHDTYGVHLRKLSIPSVLTVHGFIHRDTRLSGGAGAWMRSLIWRQVEKASWAGHPHVIAISPYVSDQLQPIVKGVIHNIDNPVDESFFNVQKIEAGRRIFCAANIIPLKNTLNLVRSHALLISQGVEVELRLAGSAGDTRYCDRIRDEIARNHLTDRVVWLGEVDHKTIRAELAAASVLALVSLHENAPMCIGEAMAAGVPVVASNRCGMLHMVAEGRSGFLVDPTSPEMIARRIRTVLEDDSMAQGMAEESRRIARERFHPSRVATLTGDVYRLAAGL